ncbi:hypothetical protein H6F61_26775 [Cyanobacteria bacterium FACHB-472]|nr:hypothetical protein [Cyanobacteria bacterium FACHB-472]
MVRTDQLDRSMFTRFADWYQNKDHLSPEAKHTVEALIELVELECVWSWMANDVRTVLECEIKERIFLACTKLGLSDYYDEFSLEDVWSLIPDEVRTALDSEIKECIRSLTSALRSLEGSRCLDFQLLAESEELWTPEGTNY